MAVGGSDYCVTHERVPPSVPPWTSLTKAHLEHRLRDWGYTPADLLYREAMVDLGSGWPYGIVVGAVEAHRQYPSVPYSLARANQATLALAQLIELRRLGSL